MSEQLMLAAAGVLELVNQQVVDAVGNGQRGVARIFVLVLQHAPSNLRHFDVVDRRVLGENYLQFGNRAP